MRHNFSQVRVAVRLSLATLAVVLVGGVASADGDAICKCGSLFHVKGGKDWFGADRSGKFTCPDCQRKGATGPQAPGANAGYNGDRNANTKTGTAAPGPRLPNTTSATPPARTPGAAATGAADQVVNGVNSLNGGTTTGGSNVGRHANTKPGTTAARAAGSVVDGINALNNGSRPAPAGSNVGRYSNTKPK